MVATFIPLIVGLLGSVTVVRTQRRAAAMKLMEAVKKLQGSGDLQVGVLGRIEQYVFNQ